MRSRSVSTPMLAGRSVSNIRSHNLQVVLLTLLREEAISRVRLAQQTGLSTTTITNLVTELLEQGIVAEEGREPGYRNGAGRPPTLLRLVPSSRCAAALHIGVDAFRVGLSDLFGRLLAHKVVPVPAEDDAELLLKEAARQVEQVIASAGISRGCLVGLGVGASGLVDPATGINLLAPNLGWHDVPIRDILAERLRMPVFVDNNVRAMALAESMFGAGRGANTLAFVYGRVGVGAGFVIGGQVYRGSRAGAGEIGHTTMIPAGGAPCRCGNTGCLETLVSEPEFIRQAQVLAARAPASILARYLSADRLPQVVEEMTSRSAIGGQAATFIGAESVVTGAISPNSAADSPIERIFAAARAGDRDTLAMLHEIAYYVGTALANLVNLINPDMIILGGLFAAGQDLLLAPIEEAMRRRAFAGLGGSVTLRVTGFGREVGVVGAAALALDAFFYRQEALPTR